MYGDNGLSAGDVLALTNGNNGFGGNGFWGGLIGLAFAAGIFGGFGNGFGGNNGYNIDSRFLERDIFNTNQNVSDTKYTTALGDQNITSAIAECCCKTQTAIADSNYKALEQAKDAQLQASVNAMNTQAMMNQCCCDLKVALHNEGEQTRALINALDKENIMYQLNQANTAIANAVQTQNILNSLGNYYPKTGVNPVSVYGYGTQIV